MHIIADLTLALGKLVHDYPADNAVHPMNLQIEALFRAHWEYILINAALPTNRSHREFLTRHRQGEQPFLREEIQRKAAAGCLETRHPLRATFR